MINLMFCGNKKAYDGIVISLISILNHTKEPINVHVLTADLHDVKEEYVPITDYQISVLNDFIKSKNKKNKIKLIDVTNIFNEEFSETINMNTSYTPYIFLRLLIDRIDGFPEKVLYLDTDIVCYKDISELYNINVDNYEYAAAIDYLGKWFIDYKYINSGVLLINLKNVKANDSFAACREVCRTRKMLLPDQTALNKKCKDKLYLPRKYNEQKERKDDTVIRHFSMTLQLLPLRKINIKPWHVDKIHNVYKIHDFDDVLEKYSQIMEMMK